MSTVRIAEIDIDVSLDNGVYLVSLLNVNGGNALSQVSNVFKSRSIPDALHKLADGLEAELSREEGKLPPVDYAVEIDHTIDAVWLRDLCVKAAQKHLAQASKATKRKALNENREKHLCFAKYADRFEHIRNEEATRIATNMGVTA